MSKSCAGCVFLYLRDQGYSNYTVEETEVHCATDSNPFLRDAKGESNRKPYDWNGDPEQDNWPMTQTSRCEWYQAGHGTFHGDVDHDALVSEHIDVMLFAQMIAQHSGYRVYKKEIDEDD